MRRRWARAAWAALVLMGLVGLLGSSPYVDLARILLTELEALDVGAYERLLVVAPHADDEIIGTAGLLMAAHDAGLDVRVVVATNGDGYLNAALRGAGLLPTTEGFRRLGALRQQESLAAMHLLGLPAETLTFLSYPDRGLASLWTAYWSHDRPFRSPYIRADHSPYLLTYNPDAQYSGDFLLGDLITLLRDQRPDLLAIPHPADEHPDHSALAAFARLALAYVEAEDPTYRPDVLGYLVHAGQYPYPATSVKAPSNLLLPPPAFSEIGAGWKAVTLTEEGISRKAMAIRAHRSQMSALGAFLEGFARETELYAVIERPLPLRETTEGEPFRPTTWIDGEGAPVEPILLDPVQDQAMRRRLPSADIAALHATRQEPGTLIVCTEVRGRRTKALSYLLRVVAVGVDGVAHYSVRSGYNQLDPEFALSDTTMVCDQVPLDSLGDPWLVALAAEARLPGGSALDTTAWQFVLIEPVTAPLLEPEAIAVGGEPTPLPEAESGGS